MNVSTAMVGFGLSKLFGLAFFVGVILFVVWAWKNLKKDDLFQLSLTLMIVGILGIFLTMSFGHMGSFGKRGFKNMSGESMMELGK